MVKLNKTALANLKALIAAGKIDRKSSWSFGADDENKLLGPDGNDWKAYAAVHLGEDTDATEDTKGRWKYPAAKGGKVYRAGVVAVESRASAQGLDDIRDAAKKLLELIDAHKDAADVVARCDFMPWYPDETQSMQTTDEGFFVGRPVVTNVGVFPYLMPDGSVVRELRPPEEVFDQDSLDSLVGKPVTNDHPTGAVTPENWKDLAVGSVGDGVRRDDYNVIAPLTICRQDAVEAVKGGKRALSCGYDAKIVDTPMSYPITDWQGNTVGEKVYKCPGVWNGVAYDRIQTGIRYNHVALVNEGRAGDAAVLRMDSAGVRLPQEKTTTRQAPQHHDKQERPMRKLKLDNGLEYEVTDEVAVAFEAKRAECADAATKAKDAAEALAAAQADSGKTKSQLQGELDTMKAKCADLEKSLAEAKGDEAIDAAVKARQELFDVADRAGLKPEDYQKKDSAAIRRDVIAAVQPDRDLTGRDDVYVQATFDTIAADLKKSDSTTRDNRSKLIPPVHQDTSRGHKFDSLEEAQDKYRESLLTGYQH